MSSSKRLYLNGTIFKQAVAKGVKHTHEWWCHLVRRAISVMLGDIGMTT